MVITTPYTTSTISSLGQSQGQDTSAAYLSPLPALDAFRNSVHTEPQFRSQTRLGRLSPSHACLYFAIRPGLESRPACSLTDLSLASVPPCPALNSEDAHRPGRGPRGCPVADLPAGTQGAYLREVAGPPAGGRSCHASRGPPASRPPPPPLGTSSSSSSSCSCRPTLSVYL